MKKLFSAALLLAATVTLGSAVAADQYDVTVKSTAAKAKARSTATVSVSPKGPFHVNLEYPVKLTITATDTNATDVNSIGGLVGYGRGASITGSSVTGGGLIAGHTGSTVENEGGLVGQMGYGGSISQTMANIPVSVPGRRGGCSPCSPRPRCPGGE